VTFDSFDELKNQNVFKPDMKLHRVKVCVHPELDHIMGITFTLRTLASEEVTKQTLQTLGTS